MNGPFGFSEKTEEFKEPSIDGYIAEINNIDNILKQRKRVSELEIKDYFRRIENVYNKIIITKKEIIALFKESPEKIIQFQKKEKILEGIITGIKKTLEGLREGCLVDIDTNLDKRQYHHALNYNQKEELLQENITSLNKFSK